MWYDDMTNYDHGNDIDDYDGDKGKGNCGDNDGGDTTKETYLNDGGDDNDGDTDEENCDDDMVMNVMMTVCHQ